MPSICVIGQGARALWRRRREECGRVGCVLFNTQTLPGEWNGDSVTNIEVLWICN